MTTRPRIEVTVFQGDDQQWYWHVSVRRGGKKIATGGEGFASAAHAERAARNVIRRLRTETLLLVRGARRRIIPVMPPARIAEVA